MFERFSGQARHVVVSAQEEARELDHNYIGTEHLLLGLLATSDSLASVSLNALEVHAACGPLVNIARPAWRKGRRTATAVFARGAGFDTCRWHQRGTSLLKHRAHPLLNRF